MELMLFLLWLITMFLFSSQRLDASAEPVLLDKPFVTVWNAPTQQCWEKYQVELDLSVFDIVINPNQSFIGQEMTIFYSTQLGYYPYYTDNGTAINGGVPQNASLKDHLLKVKKDVETVILNSTFSGLSVVDWEAWRPLWARNWDKMKIYTDRSIELIAKLHPDWPHDRVVKEAQQEFENAGRAFMKQTLALCQEMRPSGFWGFYGFPSCYNFEYKNSTFNYTGQCPEIAIKRNDQLSWLWNQSQILYPEIYLDKDLKLSQKTQKFVAHRVQEALRVGALVPNGTLPVLPYARIVYAYTMDFLAEEDLVYTIGESAALGAAGIVLWGNKDYSTSRDSCLAVKAYVDQMLGPYILNVTSSAILCSQAICSSHGRCIRQDATSRASLHLNPKSFSIRHVPGRLGFFLQGGAEKEDLIKMAEGFKCQCFKGWEGTACTTRALKQNF
ncbi:hyaluronidase-1-like [Ambystoma mexicanum]|uniref:hyaluronidase-1-like n=1 Tax=Ambystoma mexicanum TaxID=8296 RepID=UPI0037E89C00